MSLAAAGETGWTILAVDSVLLALSILCAIRRGPRIAAMAIVLASVLPVGVGAVGVLAERQSTFWTTTMINSPGPETNFEFDHARIDACLGLGVGSTLLCAVVGAAALIRAPRIRRPHEREA